MMKSYLGKKEVLAIRMSRGDYNIYRGWELPADENGNDLGMLVEYTDGGKSNHPNHKGYISWYPLDVFRKTYVQNGTFLDRLQIEKNELLEKINKLNRYVKSVDFSKLSYYQKDMLKLQLKAMDSYLSILQLRISNIIFETESNEI